MQCLEEVPTSTHLVNSFSLFHFLFLYMSQLTTDFCLLSASVILNGPAADIKLQDDGELNVNYVTEVGARCNSASFLLTND